MMLLWHICSALVAIFLLKFKDFLEIDDLKNDGYSSMQINTVLCLFIIASPVLLIAVIVKILSDRFK